MSLQILARYFTSGRVQKLPILDHYSNGSSSYASDFLARLSSDDGLDLSKLKASDLNRFDQFHVGGFASTSKVISKLRLDPTITDSVVLDVGSGLGGPARQLASARPDVRVVGVDLFEPYVELSNVFNSSLLGDNLPQFVHADCQELSIHFPPSTFHGAYMIYVGFNVQSLETLVEQLGVVCKRKARVSVFDVVAGPETEKEFTFPLPFASDESSCHMLDEESYAKAWTSKGSFQCVEEVDETAFAISALDKAVKASRKEGADIGLGRVMGDTFEEKIVNLREQFKDGRMKCILNVYVKI
ncbi:hypothetical protein TrVE_jg5520 [Triparma verrucosa]|uniref:Methyltransferase domain-containing protein n=1 Tax=Triparma verrucosa TaxID=1606542 RepID=A0A9W7BI30_9STRA|nr:hypothetical protein TrVE_jg5520 [Triparma verrucosa]